MKPSLETFVFSQLMALRAVVTEMGIDLYKDQPERLRKAKEHFSKTNDKLAAWVIESIDTIDKNSLTSVDEEMSRAIVGSRLSLWNEIEEGICKK